MLTACEHCGSAACLKEAPLVCRHTRKARGPIKVVVPVATAAMAGPVVHTAIIQAPMNKKRGRPNLGRH